MVTLQLCTCPHRLQTNTWTWTQANVRSFSPPGTREDGGPVKGCCEASSHSLLPLPWVADGSKFHSTFKFWWGVGLSSCPLTIVLQIMKQLRAVKTWFLRNRISHNKCCTQSCPFLFWYCPFWCVENGPWETGPFGYPFLHCRGKQ